MGFTFFGVTQGAYLLFLKRWFSEIATGLQYLGFCSLCLQRFSSSKHLLIQFSVSNLADLFRLPQVCALQQQLVSISSVSDKQHSSRWMASCSTATAAQFSFRFALLVRFRATSKFVSSLALLCSSSSFVKTACFLFLFRSASICSAPRYECVS